MSGAVRCGSDLLLLLLLLLVDKAALFLCELVEWLLLELGCRSVSVCFFIVVRIWGSAYLLLWRAGA